MDEWRSDRIGSAERGENPTVITRMPSGLAVLGDTQFLPGYCVLLSQTRAASINALALHERAQFLIDMTILGDAILQVCSPRRINYAILMNKDEFLHAHPYPRYVWEPTERQSGSPFRYPVEMWQTEPFDETRHARLRNELANAVAEIARVQ